MYSDLHNHLYGCLSAETLWEIGRKNRHPKWERFIPEYKKVFGKEINPDSFFETYSRPEKLGELYWFRKPGPFAEFQCSFNLIIALSVFDEEEIYEAARRTAIEHYHDGVSYAEYRLMYSPAAGEADYVRKSLSACRGLKKAEEESGGKFQGRLAVSLYRNSYWKEYEWLKKLQDSDNTAKHYITGIDFCFIEEGFPPKEKKEFFLKVKEDNILKPDGALAILYHVGESFQDKSALSSCRWVIESAESGAHRLGHCIALGIRPEIYRDRKITESAEERRDQIRFMLKNYEEIRSFGPVSERCELEKELEDITSLKNDEKINYHYSQKNMAELETFQKFGMERIKKTDAVIESCPTSNLLIGMITEKKDLPVFRFIENGMKLVLGSDDPGIFRTDLKSEFKILSECGVRAETLERIRQNGFLYKSENLSGRKNG
ncbi:MAG TPA: adenosine deaminase [Leptospiraceae bacterium]|nr:adenosine deaminase [Leptospiraceae bacterium]